MANNSATSSSQNILHGVLMHLAEKPLDMNKNAEELTSAFVLYLIVFMLFSLQLLFELL